MITKTAREIIRNAMTLANADNSEFVDFELATNLLNTNYKYLYNEIIKETLLFTNKIEVTEPTPLPNDCYRIISVNDRAGNNYSQASNKSRWIDNGYFVENFIFYPPKNMSGTFIITYSTIPDTITAPRKWKQVSTQTISGTTNRFVTYNDGSISISNNTNTNYLGNTLSIDFTNQTITWGDEDVSDFFKRDDTTITQFQFHSPYAVVSYSDNAVFVFTGFRGVEWNYNCIYGHDTRGQVYALKTDDTTGFGMLFRNSDDNNYYYAPFVPDTILSYPNNTLFSFLEYRIAFQIASMLGMGDLLSFLDSMQKEAEVQFYNTLDVTSGGHIITNSNSRRGWYV